jgi:hypothetical protein
MKQIDDDDDDDDVPEGTKDEVYSALVSSINKCCLMIANVQPKHNSCIYM